MTTTTSLHSDVFDRAKTIRDSIGPVLPYWESILISAWQSNEPKPFFAEAIRHPSSANEKKIEVSRAEATPDGIRQIADRSDGALALSSLCRLVDDTTRFIPLMDFRVAPSSENLAKIASLVKAIGIPGAILKSGNSYHFIGYSLLSAGENLSFLGKCILLAPITDSRYIGHRLIEGSSDLRISASTAKNFLPVVEAVIE